MRIAIASRVLTLALFIFLIFVFKITDVDYDSGVVQTQVLNPVYPEIVHEMLDD